MIALVACFSAPKFVVASNVFDATAAFTRAAST
jgi:hypothetical protein